MVLSSDLFHDGLQGVRIRGVTDVMQETRGTDRHGVLLGQPDGIGHLACEIICSETMFETGVVGTGEDHIRHTELLDPAEPLHLVPVQQVEEHPVHFDSAVHGVVYGLHAVQIIHRLSRVCRPRC